MLALLLCAASEACAAFQPDLMVKLSSEGDAAYLVPGLYEQVAAVQVKSQGAALGIPVAYLVQVRNAGDTPDRFLITGGGSSSGYGVQYLDESGVDRTAEVAAGGYSTPLLAPGGSTVLTLRVTPSLLPLALNFDVRVRGVSAADATKADEVQTATCASGNVAALTVSSPADQSGVPGSVVTYAYTVTNTGNAPNAFNLSTGGNWSGALHADNVPTSSTGTLPAGAGYHFFLSITIPPGADNAAYSESVLTVTGTGASISDRVVTTAVAPVFTLVDSVRNVTRGGVFAAAAEAAPGDTLEYRLAVTNSGGASATGVDLASQLPENTQLVPGSLLIAVAPSSDGGGCPLSGCGQAGQTGNTISARLGDGATADAGGTLPVGRTLYLYFRAQVQ